MGSADFISSSLLLHIQFHFALQQLSFQLSLTSAILNQSTNPHGHKRPIKYSGMITALNGSICLIFRVIIMSDKSTQLKQFEQKRGKVTCDSIYENATGAKKDARWLLLKRETDAATDVIDYLHEYRTYQTYCTVVSNFCILQICFWYENHDEKIKKAIVDVLEKESLLRIWGRGESGIGALKRLADIGARWDTESASEFLRLFGAIIEDVADVASDEKAKIIDFRIKNSPDIKGVNTDNSFNALFIEMQKMKERFKLWTGFKDYDFFKKGEMRTRVRATEVPVGERMRAIANNKGGKFGDLSKAKIQLIRNLHYGNVGTAIHRVDDLSLIGHIQNKYALPMGADISGTTSDIIGIIDMLNNEKFFPGVQPLLKPVPKLIQKLGPILAMVKNRHHTFLECALVFNMNMLKITDEEKKNPKIDNISDIKGYQPCQYHSLIDMIPDSFKIDETLGYFKYVYREIKELLKQYSVEPLTVKDGEFDLINAYDLKGEIYGGSIGALNPNQWIQKKIKQGDTPFELNKENFRKEIVDWLKALKMERDKQYNDSITVFDELLKQQPNNNNPN